MAVSPEQLPGHIKTALQKLETERENVNCIIRKLREKDWGLERKNAAYMVLIEKKLKLKRLIKQIESEFGE